MITLHVVEEVNISEATLSWLLSCGEHYFPQAGIPEEAKKLDLVEGANPDWSLSEKGKRVVHTVRHAAEEAIQRLKTHGVEATPHGTGILIPHEKLCQLWLLCERAAKNANRETP